MIDSIKFDTSANSITVTMDDGTSVIYTFDMAAQYATDYPNRIGDLVAMGWI